jgi:hypothetical protein
MRTYQNEHNMLVNFPRCLRILLLQTSKSDNNAPDIDAILTSNLEKHLYYQIKSQFSWPPIMPKQRECTLYRVFFF